MQRRDFLRYSAAGAAAAAVAGTSDIAKAAERISSLGEEPDGKPLLASAPMLQNFAETSIGVAFAVNDLANGYVLIGERKDLKDARKVLCGGYRLADIDDRVIQVRITGLKPATKYYYRIGADRIHYGGGYDMKVLGNEEDPRVYSFTTAGKGLQGKFCVINDTHVRWPAIGAELDKIAEIAPACVIWNGDASNTEEKLENLVNIYLDHSLDRKDYAAETPYLFCPGNHDSRGRANRHLEKVWMYRQPEERDVRDWDLGRNFAVRLGEMARRPPGRDGPRGPGHGRGQAGHESPVRRPVQERRVPRGADGLAPGRPEAAGNRLRALSRGFLSHPAVRRRPFAQPR